MTARIHLKRVGKTHVATYRVVVVDSHKKHDGRVIEELDIYDPQPNPSKIRIDSDRAQYWLGIGTQPSSQVRSLLVLVGDVARFNGRAGTISRVEVPEADKAAAAAKAVRAAEAKAERLKAGKAAAEAEEEAKAIAEASTEEAIETGEGA